MKQFQNLVLLKQSNIDFECILKYCSCNLEVAKQGTRECSVPTEHFFNVLSELVLFRSDRTFL